MPTRHRPPRRPAHPASLATILLLTVAALAPAAVAQVWSESGDAGDLVASAQGTAGAGPLTTLTGTLSSHGDIDVYCIDMVATPPAATPLVSIMCALNSDPSLWLFDASGVGVMANGTCAGGMKIVPAPNYSLTPGTYYIAFSHADYLPSSSGGAIWASSWTGFHTPDGSGAASPLVSWTGPSTFVVARNYSLTLNWMAFCDPPTPTDATSWGSLKALYGN